MRRNTCQWLSECFACHNTRRIVYWITHRFLSSRAIRSVYPLQYSSNSMSDHVSIPLVDSYPNYLHVAILVDCYSVGFHAAILVNGYPKCLGTAKLLDVYPNCLHAIILVNTSAIPTFYELQCSSNSASDRSTPPLVDGYRISFCATILVK